VKWKKEQVEGKKGERKREKREREGVESISPYNSHFWIYY